MKKTITFILLFLLICSGSSYNVYAKETPPSVSADSAVVLDAATGEILYAKNPDSAYPPASTTKIMTALLTLENTNLDDKVVIGNNPPAVEGTRLGLFPGEELTVRDLLYGLLLASDNDCAEALAEHISGSLHKFAAKMNTRAKELGAKNTNFINPTGLFNEKHKTSARDLSLIMRELHKNPEYSKIATSISYTIPPTNKSSKPRTVWNENKLVQKQSMYYYSGCQGGKTGYTIQSLHSYTAVATRNGETLIVALVHDKNKTFFPDSISLFNFGFNNFQLVKLYSKGDLVTTYNKNKLSVPLIADSNFYYVKEKGDKALPHLSIKNENLSFKLFKVGDVVSSADIYFKGKNIGKLNLSSGISHDEKQILNSDIIENIIIRNKYAIPVVIALLVVIAIFTVKKIYTLSK
ncbi:serine hydrolase [Clostridium sp. MT-14]|jgi:D-alanyl-D-alanine carboxypeptidase|uniref:serine-type D-Ala-D-Ala carboxypeptidase n=1 Tax=Clostridium aromativorans TaxID=2836848 RepID=A0ABS8N4R0_9CLOT|nr:MULTISPECIES: D-alanyl-D-alanine carboxypeptidase family protein [Clostridium]KAA8673328.1 D-alanyl-D-alanine carboxypeptidase [Clostridium sp. HV4-5-A1G]MCC9294164.1 D-alanyl-D-alanine carboxypeptidase [Clostridium aromativorans]CAB1240135.1 D-alanyl-D-alanine carboxypeptidase [Clostridiaceae bacterium BL-3]